MNCEQEIRDIKRRLDDVYENRDVMDRVTMETAIRVIREDIVLLEDGVHADVEGVKDRLDKLERRNCTGPITVKDEPIDYQQIREYLKKRYTVVLPECGEYLFCNTPDGIIDIYSECFLGAYSGSHVFPNSVLRILDKANIPVMSEGEYALWKKGG